jgi:hypothetical protein
VERVNVMGMVAGGFEDEEDYRAVIFLLCEELF